MSFDTLNDRTELARVALEAAREAGAFLQTGWRTRPRTDHKRATVDLVTRYDRESETFLRTRLARGTGLPIVGEEQGGERATEPGGATWYVDPLDGTTNFVHGHPFYCVSLGLVVSSTRENQPGEPVIGVVVAPALGVEWVGIVAPDGKGIATRNGEPCEVSTVSSFSDALLATGFPYDRRTSPDNNFDAFVAIKKQAQAVRRCGSAALDLCLVADGTYDGYWERKLGVWDIAAGAALVRAAGGRLSNYDGGPADVTTGQLVATNGRIHDALIAALRPHW